MTGKINKSRLLELLRSGVRRSDAAKEFGVSRAAITMFCRWHELTSGARWTRRARVLEPTPGESLSARKYGRRLTTLAGHIDRKGQIICNPW